MGFIVSAIAGNKKGKNIKRAAARNLEFATDSRDYTRDLLDPYLGLGRGGIEAQGDALGFSGQEGFDRSVNNFQSSPFATLPFNEGQRTLEASAGARGDLLSGQTGKDFINYGQNQANNNFDRYFQAITGATRVGQNATGQAGNNEANFVNAATGASNQRAVGQNEQVDAISGGVGGALGALGSIFGGL